MAIPNDVREQAERTLAEYCEAKVPERVRDKLRLEYELAGSTASLIERRVPWRGEGEWTCLEVARFRYTAKTGLWSLYWADRNHEFHRYDLVEPTADIKDLLEEVDRDPTGIFWG